MLTLGDKYDFADLRDDGLKVLEGLFPQDISAWDLTYKDRKCCWGHALTHDEDDFVDMACTVKNLNLPGLHARILYSCCSLSLPRLTCGLLGESDKKPTLCNEDLVRCLTGRERLLEAWLDMVQIFELWMENQCDACTERMKFLQMLFKPDAKTSIIGHDPLNIEHWVWIFEGPEEALGLCDGCRVSSRQRIKELRQELLDSLEERFK